MSQLLHNDAFNPSTMPSKCLSTIEAIINENDTDKYFIIVPTGKIVRYHKYNIIKEYYQKYNKPFSSVNIFTFQSFVKYCFNKIINRFEYHIISDAFRLALFEEASQNAGLKFFKKSGSDKMSYALLKKLSEVVMGLKEDGIKPEELSKEIEQALTLKNKFKTDLNRLTDIFALYSTYQSILGGKMIDFPDMLSLAIKKIAENPDENINKIFSTDQIVILDGFTEFKPPEVDFIRLFSNSKIPFAINVEYDDEQGPLYTILEKSILQLNGAGFRISNNRDLNDSQTSKINYLKHNLFNITDEKDNRFSGMIKLIETPTIREEVHYVTKLIKNLILNENYKTSEICIALRHPDKYSPLFRDSFFLNKIPVNVSDRFQLDKSPVIVAVFAFIDLMRRGFRTDDLKKALKNPFITIPDSNEKKIDLDNLISVAVKLRIKGGRFWEGAEGWLKRIGQKKEFLENKLAMLEDDAISDKFEITIIKNEITSLIKAHEDFNFILSKIPKINRKYTASEFADFIKRDIIVRFSINNNIRNRVKFDELYSATLSKQEKTIIIENIEKDARAFTALLEIIDEMEFVLNNLKRNEVFPLDELLNNLKTAISDKKYQISEKSGYGVTITTIEQTRQIPYKVMFLCGAVDGAFPTPYKPETFLGKELPDTEQRHILTERMQFFQFLTNSPEMFESGEKKIYITYPKFSEEKELVRSPFVDSLVNITTIQEDNSIINIPALLSRPGESEVNIDTSWIRSVSSDFEQQSYFADKVLSGQIGEETAVKTDSNIQDLNEQIKDFLEFIKTGSYLEARIDKVSLPAEIKEYFEKKADQPVSVSELEEYAKCPYRYFLKYILKLKEPEDTDISISPIEIGNIMHRILFEFYTGIANEQLESGNMISYRPAADKLPVIMPVALDPGAFKYYESKLLRLAQSHLEQIKFDHPLFKIDEEIITGVGGKGGLLRIWLKAELERINSGWQSSPALFEFAFGMRSYNKLDSPVISLDGLKIKGKIDRIELNTNENVFIISDYKLSGGSLPGLSQVQAGKSFQIPLYLLVAEKIFKESYNLEFEPAGGIYYIFRTKKQAASHFKTLLTPKNYQISTSVQNRSAIKDYDQLMTTLETSLLSAKLIIEKIGNGQFDVTPDKDACIYCKLASICRINKF